MTMIEEKGVMKQTKRSVVYTFLSNEFKQRVHTCT